MYDYRSAKAALKALAVEEASFQFLFGVHEALSAPPAVHLNRGQQVLPAIGEHRCAPAVAGREAPRPGSTVMTRSRSAFSSAAALSDRKLDRVLY